MELFRRKKQAGAVGSIAPYTLSFRLGEWYKEREMQLAAYLNRRTRGFSFRCWFILLVGFCGLVGSYLVYLLIGIFN